MKLKDYVTLGNLLSGVGAWIALLHHEFDLACYLLMLAYVFDVADGPVARWTRQYDAFGGYFDTACDFVTNSVTATLLTYYAFRFNAGYPWWVAAAIAAFPVSLGTIRQAKSDERPLSYPCYFLGFPRPAAAFFIVALVQSFLFRLPEGPAATTGHLIAAALIILVSVLHLSTFPFISHHQRRWMGALKFGMVWFLIGTPTALLIGWLAFDAPRLMFDWLLISLTGYLTAGWTQIPRTDLHRIRTYVAGGPKHLPLVHREQTWRPRTAIPAFDPLEPDPPAG